MTVEVCPGGREAVQWTRQRDYDLILMEHMMPEMDGIEATAAIRAWERETLRPFRLPVIALSANAVQGAEDLFREKGFNDFISKPIDVRQLDEALERWLPREKLIWRIPPSGAGGEGLKWEIRKAAGENDARWAALTRIGVDVRKGISLTGGSADGYVKVLLVLKRDIRDRLGSLAAIPGAAELPGFTIQVHALKSATLSVGAADVSQAALELETAGKAGDGAAVREKLPLFREKLETLTAALEEVLGGAALSGEGADGAAEERIAAHLPRLEKLKAGLLEEQIGVVDAILKELELLPFDRKTHDLIGEISDAVLISEFPLAAEILDALLVAGGGE
jgi:CheY-like chemotaxis protein/HPt (histidine-containing phosphotransfer) domain-containing protein